MNPHTLLGAFERAPGDPHRPSSTPIHQTATFAQESPESFGRYDYARSDHPTRGVLESLAARLDGGAGSLAYASGMAAIAATFRMLDAGGRVLLHHECYGGTARLLEDLAATRGIVVRRADLVDAAEADYDRLLDAGIDLVLVESLTNPSWRAPDLRALGRACRRAGARLAVDATALSPWWQRPIALGADLVIHSATKLLGGHGDVTAGLVTARDHEVLARLAWLRNAEGCALAPFDAWLLLRGMRTLGVRLDRQGASASVVAARLAERDDLRRVHFVGLPNHPDAIRHARQASGPGVAISLETGDAERSAAMLRRLRRFPIAVSFGSIDSSASLPFFMSHASVPPGRPKPPRDLIRLSIGLEDPEDLLADLTDALDATRHAVAGAHA